MLLSVCMPHSGYDEVDHIEALESVRAMFTEGKREGAVDFFIGGDLNIELKLHIADDEHRGLDRVEWYGMYLSAVEVARTLLLMRKNKVVPTTARVQLHRDQHRDEQ